MISSAESGIEYLSVPSDELINSLAEKSELSELKFLGVCNEHIKSGADFRTAWTAALEDKANTRYMNDEDIGLLMSFGSGLGTTDTPGQKSNCRLHTELVKDKLSFATEYYNSYASLSRGMGIVCGIGAVIILI